MVARLRASAKLAMADAQPLEWPSPDAGVGGGGLRRRLARRLLAATAAAAAMPIEAMGDAAAQPALGPAGTCRGVGRLATPCRSSVKRQTGFLDLHTAQYYMATPRGLPNAAGR